MVAFSQPGFKCSFSLSFSPIVTRNSRAEFTKTRATRTPVVNRQAKKEEEEEEE